MGDTTKRVYQFIRDYIRIHGTSPSYPEIADGCHMARGSVGIHLAFLEARGLIERAHNSRRGIILRDANTD
jgi:hypothetical protein